MCDDTVHVALRIRPLVESEIEKRCQMCLSIVHVRIVCGLLGTVK